MARRVTVFALLSVLLATVPAARADIVFTNFGPNYSYNTSMFAINPVGAGAENIDYAQGDTFTPTGTYTLTDIQIALSHFGGTNTDALQVNLTRDSGSDTPGTVLTTMSIPPGTLGQLGNDNPPIILTPSSPITLTAGTQYWVTVTDPDVSEDNYWNWNSTGDSSNEAESFNGGSTWVSPSLANTPGAYEVDGTPQVVVPEPSSLQVVLVIGALSPLGSGWRWLRRRTQRPAMNRR